jgi:hypothetical protein
VIDDLAPVQPPPSDRVEAPPLASSSVGMHVDEDLDRLIDSLEPEFKKTWKQIARELRVRHRLLTAAVKDVADIQDANALALAATDVFVEKAQFFLTRRAQRFFLAGGFLASIVIIWLGAAAWYLTTHDPLLVVATGTGPGPQLTGYSVTLKILHSVSLGGLVVGAAAFLVQLTRAALHEGSVLLSRRHALRFGRLFVYSRKGNVSLQELEEAFQWNRDFGSAFKDIKSEAVSRTAVTRMLQAVPDLLKASAELVSAARGTPKPGHETDPKQ